VAGAVVFYEGEKWQLLFLELSFVSLCFAFLWTLLLCREKRAVFLDIFSL
jgi:hypothetical protein